MDIPEIEYMGEFGNVRVVRLTLLWFWESLIEILPDGVCGSIERVVRLRELPASGTNSVK